MFSLPAQFIDSLRDIDPKFGYNGLGEIVYKRTYARKMENGEKEEWIDTIQRVINGSYTIQRDNIGDKWDITKATKSAETMFSKMYTMKFLPGGRSLWCMGTDVIHKRGLGMALYNCAAVSTQDIATVYSKPFVFLMDCLMLGVGVGFDTRGKGTITIQRPKYDSVMVHEVEDTREGWVKSVEVLLDSYLIPSDKQYVKFDYSCIREKGIALKTFGGVSSGPEPLRDLHENIRSVLENNIDNKISTRVITDIMNMIGVCVVAGNVRRCLPHYSLVVTYRGLKKISDITTDDYVLTRFTPTISYNESGRYVDWNCISNYRKVNKVFEQGKQQLVCIYTTKGILHCTENHKIAVYSNYEITWVKASQLQRGSQLCNLEAPIHYGSNDSCHHIFNIKLIVILLVYGIIKPNGIIIPLEVYNNHSSIFNTTFSTATILVSNIDVLFILDDKKEKILRGVYFGDADVNFADNTLSFKDKLPRFLITASHTQRYIFMSSLVKYIENVNFVITSHSTLLELQAIASTTSFTISTTFGVDSKGNVGGNDSGNDSGKVGGNDSGAVIDTDSIHVTTLDVMYMMLKIVVSPIKYCSRLIGNTCSSIAYRCASLIGGVSGGNGNGNDNGNCSGNGNGNGGINGNINVSSQNMDNRTLKGIGNYKVGDGIKVVINYADDTSFPVILDVKPLDIIEETYDIEVDDNHMFYSNGILVHNSAEIAFGDITDNEFLNLKNYEMNPERERFGWTSNNTVFADLGSDYSKIVDGIVNNGEPGICWLHNVQRYSRMIEPEGEHDTNAILLNPCGEISLENYEVCNLVEVFLNRHSNIDEFLSTLKYAFLYAKTVTMVPIHWKDTQKVVRRNRRIGCSLSGIAQFISNNSLHELRRWCITGYNYLVELDGKLSNIFSIPTSIKLTTVKPSGTISLLAGATPGVHSPISPYYIRRLRIAKSDPIMSYIRNCNYPFEPCVLGTDNYVVEIPIAVGSSVSCNRGMWEQLELAAFMQYYWADNQVSCTVTFDPIKEGPEIASALNYYQYRLKSISLLPDNTASYKQKPYESITKEEYKKRYRQLTLHSATFNNEDTEPMIYCDSEQCVR